jgi:hypothetical protein
MLAQRDRYWDIAVYGPDNQLALAVEVKSIPNRSPEWAARFRRNLLAHQHVPNAPYFMFVLPDRIYLWVDSDIDEGTVEPTYDIDAQPILHDYFAQTGFQAEQLGSQSLELIVASWLSQLIHQDVDELDDSLTWLVESGLYEAIAGGFVEYGVLA